MKIASIGLRGAILTVSDFADVIDGTGTTWLNLGNSATANNYQMNVRDLKRIKYPTFLAVEGGGSLGIAEDYLLVKIQAEGKDR